MKHSAIRIGFVDDHEIVREGIAQALSKHNIQVSIQAANGRELIEKIEKSEYPPEICIIDINMPELNGYLTQEELTRRWPSIKTLALTVLASEAATVRMMMAGAKGFLDKTCTIPELVNAIRVIQTNGIYHTAIVNTHIINAIQKKELSFPELNENEMKVLLEICSGHHQGEIAAILKIPIRKVQTIRDSLYKKMAVDNPVKLALYAVQLGLIELSTVFPGKT